MFETEAKEYAEKTKTQKELDVLSIVHDWGRESLTQEERHLWEGVRDRQVAREQGFKDGAEFGYNKANEWHYVSEKGLPKESGRYFVYVGGGEKGVYPLDFETEYNDFGYWCVEVASASLGVTDTIFETVTERNEDKVIAWKEIILPKESE